MLQLSRSANLEFRLVSSDLLGILKAAGLGFLSVLLILATSGCGGGCPQRLQDLAPARIDAVTQDPQGWNILHSSGTPNHPAAPPTSWAVFLPGPDGKLGYITTPYRTTTRPQLINLTFQVTESPDAIPVATEAAASPCRDHDPCTPVAEFHVLIQVQGDDGSECGRWWFKPGFRLTNLADDSFDQAVFVGDGQPHTVTIPLKSDQWTSVTGRGSPADFESALQKIGYVGVTFGGSDFFGHGAAVQQGTVQFQMINYQVR